MKLIISWVCSNWLELVAIIIASFAAYFAYIQNKTTKRLSHLHINPSIKCMLDFPEKENPILFLSNDGDIPVVSLSIKHEMYIYNKNKETLISAIQMGYLFSDKVVFKKLLDPSEHINQELVRCDPVEGKVLIYKFILKYYRESDMQEYSSVELFFIDDGKIYNHKDYKNNDNYQRVMISIDSYKFPERNIAPGKLKTVLDGIDKKEK